MTHLLISLLVQHGQPSDLLLLRQVCPELDREVQFHMAATKAYYEGSATWLYMSSSPHVREMILFSAVAACVKTTTCDISLLHQYVTDLVGNSESEEDAPLVAVRCLLLVVIQLNYGVYLSNLLELPVGQEFARVCANNEVVRGSVLSSNESWTVAAVLFALGNVAYDAASRLLRKKDILKNMTISQWLQVSGVLKHQIQEIQQHNEAAPEKTVLHVSHNQIVDLTTILDGPGAGLTEALRILTLFRSREQSNCDENETDMQKEIMVDRLEEKCAQARVVATALGDTHAMICANLNRLLPKHPGEDKPPKLIVSDPDEDIDDKTSEGVDWENVQRGQGIRQAYRAHLDKCTELENGAPVDAIDSRFLPGIEERVSLALENALFDYRMWHFLSIDNETRVMADKKLLAFHERRQTDAEARAALKQLLAQESHSEYDD